MKKLSTLLFFLFLTLTSFAQQSNQALLTVYDPVLSESYLKKNKIKIVSYLDFLKIYVVEFEGSYPKFERKCLESKLFKIIEQNKIEEITLDYIPNDPNFNGQWFLKQISDKDIDADEAWDSLPPNNPITKVAIFDGGIDLTHEDLIGNIVTPFNTVTNQYFNGQFVNEFDRHGTACSGTIAAVTNNGVGGASIGNNKVHVMPINIMSTVSSGGTFSTSTVIQVNAINAAIAQGCAAISMSYGGSGYSATLDAAFQSAKTQARSGKGIFICASTGNNYSGTAMPYPAAYPAVYGIGATTSGDARATFSNYGTIVDISAPGAAISTTDRMGITGYNSGNYATVSGTSFSCPITAGAGALLAYKNPDLTEAQIMQILATTVDQVGGYVYYYDSNWPYAYKSNELGYGRINLKKAILATPTSGNPIDNPPTASHNIIVSNCSVSNNTPNVGSTIIINTKQSTTAPDLEGITPILQYRLSVDNVWSDNDIIIGIDTSYIGNGISNEIENIEYIVPMTTGIKYILIKANYDNSVQDASIYDNTCSIQINIVNPGSGGTDAEVTWLTAPVVTCTNSASNIVYRFKNTGSVPITSMTWRVSWEICPNGEPGVPSYYQCSQTYNSSSYGGFNILPNANSYNFTQSICIANCSPGTYNIINIGSTRNRKVEILTVNNQPADDFIGNNIALLPITRIACTTSEIYNTNNEETPKFEFYSITGQLLDYYNIDMLPHGIYIMKIIYSNQTEIIKISK